jgi:hypothetical protein
MFENSNSVMGFVGDAFNVYEKQKALETQEKAAELEKLKLLNDQEAQRNCYRTAQLKIESDQKRVTYAMYGLTAVGVLVVGYYALRK